jgi:hypothetical protein
MDPAVFAEWDFSKSKKSRVAVCNIIEAPD